MFPPVVQVRTGQPFSIEHKKLKALVAGERLEKVKVGKRKGEREREKRKPGSSCNAFLPLTRYPRWRGTAAAADG